MESKEILILKKNILEKLSKRQLKEAIEQLMKLTVNMSDLSASYKLEELETNYKYMLHYQFEGMADRERSSIYQNILRALYELTDDASDELLTSVSTQYLYERIRINSVRTPIIVSELRVRLREVLDSLSLMKLMEDGEDRQRKLRELSVKRERLGVELFDQIFISSRADTLMEEEFRDFLSDGGIPIREKSLFVSALTLSLFHRFDFRKISVLMDVCEEDRNVEVRQRAVVGLVIILQMYDIRWQLYPECQHQLDTLSEEPQFRKSVLTVIKQLIRSRETEKISRKMIDEIIPEMMKLNSLAGKKLNMQDLMGETDFSEKNPEWKKELVDSGIAGKLQEYSNLQMEGADVFHSTFSGLKNFPFFREISNWFLPFDIHYSELQLLSFGGGNLSGLLKTAVLNSGHMCDSDKYSFAFSVLQIPESQRQTMLQRFGEEADQIKELQREAKEFNPQINEEIISNQYIQNLYRFFKLYPNKGSFFDIFKLKLNFYDKKSLSPLISSPGDMLTIASYCFDKNFFSEAASIYSKLIDRDRSIEDSDIWQKLGYCFQMVNRLTDALDAYLQAELRAPQNSWVIKRIAQVYRLLKDPQHSLEYYQHASLLTPDNITIELNIGHCYLELKEYEKALNSYFKVELLEDGRSDKAWRPIAWTAFLMGKFDVARKYYQKILKDKPSASDFLNAGHVELCSSDYRAALNFYLKVIDKLNGFDKFAELFEEDRNELVRMGVDTVLLSFLLDELRYKID